MPERSDDSDTTFRRKKARRSCSNCQRSHRTCGDERPCMECKRRGMTATCADGDRKIPKYLYDMSQCPPTSDLYCGRARLNVHANIPDSCAFPLNLVNQSEATFMTQADPGLNYSTEQGSYDFVDPAILHIESPVLLLSRQTAKSHPQEQKNLTAHSLEINMSSRPVLLAGCHGGHGVERTLSGKTVGFTIGSGWSSTFLPCGMNEILEN